MHGPSTYLQLFIKSRVTVQIPAVS